METLQYSTAFDRIPLEIWDQIAQALPVNSLRSLVLSSRTLYKCANRFLYRTVYFFGTYDNRPESPRAQAIADQDSCFGIHRAQSWLSHSHRRSHIIHVRPFLEAIITNPKLRCYVTGASFGWKDSANAQDVLIAKTCLEYIKPSLSFLHIALPDFDTKFAITTNVTFLEIEYPDEDLLTDAYGGHRHNVDLHMGLRDSVYSIFCIPTLRHLSIRNARTWQAFYPVLPPSRSRTGTSNVVSLSLPNTVPLSRDLAEILTWPRALRYFYHENALGRRYHFQHHDSEQLACPEAFIKGVHPQRNTIEELIYDNEEPDYGNVATTFGTALRDFSHLKRLAVSRTCLLRDWQHEEANHLHEKFPPNVEEICLLLDRDDLDEEVNFLLIGEALRGIAMNKKQYYPSLRTFVVWALIGQAYYNPAKCLALADEALSRLDLVTTFHACSIEIEFTTGVNKEFGSHTEMGWRTLER